MPESLNQLVPQGFCPHNLFSMSKKPKQYKFVTIHKHELIPTPINPINVQIYLFSLTM